MNQNVLLSQFELRFTPCKCENPESYMAHVLCITMVSMALMIFSGPRPRVAFSDIQGMLEWVILLAVGYVRRSLSSQGPWRTASGLLLLSSLLLSLEIRPSLVANNKTMAVGKHLFTCSVQSQGSSTSFSRKAPRWGLKGCAYLEVCLWAF